LVVVGVPGFIGLPVLGVRGAVDGGEVVPELVPEAGE